MTNLLLTASENPRSLKRRANAAARHVALAERLGSPVTATIRLRALEQYARDHLPCRQAAAALCCNEGLDWLAARLEADPAASRAELEAVMNWPEFWRDQDEAIVARVRAGFDRLYPGPVSD